MLPKMRILRNKYRWQAALVILAMIVLVVGGVQLAFAAFSQETAPETAVTAANTTAPQQFNLEIVAKSVTEDDEACILCHTDTDAVIELASGEMISVLVDTAVLDNSAHGTHAETPLGCTDCHAVNDYQYPHDAVTAENLEAYQLDKGGICERCHVEPHLTSHPETNDADSETAVGCTSCHGGHNVITNEQWQNGDGIETCVNCHNNVEDAPNDANLLQQIIQDGLFQSQYVTNDYCLACHQQEGLVLTFPNGDTKSATIDPGAFHDSVHGDSLENGPLQCKQCHEGYTYPHEPVMAESARTYVLENYPTCINCHENKYDENQDDVHLAALADGKEEAAVCTDCHGAHDTPIPNEPHQRIPETCRKCHSTIYDEYATSVHGAALLDESNQDVPTCIDCHGVHTIDNPETAAFRLRSPEICATCHANEELMTEYDISTDVFDTYVADFHGTTVTIFEHQDPNAETNKAVCYDCHGVHNIKRPDDPEAGIKANLLATCQQCHPDANENFPDAWTSHFQPSLEHNPLVYFVNLFYQIVIPVTVGLLGFLVATDIYRRIRTALRS